MLRDADRAQLEQHICLGDYSAKDIVLAEEAEPDALFIIESGVVSVLLQRPDGWLEIGRMGTGELLGESCLVNATPKLGRFFAYTDSMLSRIDSADLELWLAEHPE